MYIYIYIPHVYIYIYTSILYLYSFIVYVSQCIVYRHIAYDELYVVSKRMFTERLVSLVFKTFLRTFARMARCLALMSVLPVAGLPS